MTNKKTKKSNKSEKAPPAEPNGLAPAHIESQPVVEDSKLTSAPEVTPKQEKPEVPIDATAKVAVEATDAIPSTPLTKVVASTPSTTESVAMKSSLEKVPVTPATANASYSDLYSNIAEESSGPIKYSSNPLQSSVGKAYNLDHVYAAESISPLRNAPEDELNNPMFRVPNVSKVAAPVTPEVSPASKENSPSDGSTTEKVIVAFASSSCNKNKSIPIYVNPNATLKSTRSFTKQTTTATSTTISSSVTVTASSSSEHHKYSSAVGAPSDSALVEPSPLSTSSAVSGGGGGEVYHLESTAQVFDDIASEITESSSAPEEEQHQQQQAYTAPKPSYREQLLPSIEEEQEATNKRRMYTLVDDLKDTVLSLLGFKTECSPSDMTLSHWAATVLLDALLFFPLLWLSVYVWLFRCLWWVVSACATLTWGVTMWAVSVPFCAARSVYLSVTNTVVAVLATVLRCIPGGSKIALQISPHALRG